MNKIKEIFIFIYEKIIINLYENTKDTINDILPLLFIMSLLFSLVGFFIYKDKTEGIIPKTNGYYSYHEKIDNKFILEKKFMTDNDLTNNELEIYKFKYKRLYWKTFNKKCYLNNKSEIDFIVKEIYLGLDKKKVVYLNSKQLVDFGSKKIYNKLNTCFNFLIDVYRLNYVKKDNDIIKLNKELNKI